MLQIWDRLMQNGFLHLGAWVLIYSHIMLPLHLEAPDLSQLIINYQFGIILMDSSFS